MDLGRTLVVLLAIVCLGLTLFMAALMYSSTLINYEYDETSTTWNTDHFESNFNFTNGGFFAINDLSIKIAVRNITNHIVLNGTGSEPLVASGETIIIPIIFSINSTTIVGLYNFTIVVELQVSHFITVTIIYTNNYSF